VYEQQTSEAVPEKSEEIVSEIPYTDETNESNTEVAYENPTKVADEATLVFDVPFYSQLQDISSTKWKKLGCGIASTAMLIEFYKPGAISSVDSLLDEGIASGAYLNGAGWIHKGLASLAEDYGLTGRNYDLSTASMNTAFTQFKTALNEGPVIASVYYTFDPQSPIPHLVVVNGIDGDTVYYNDPSEKSGKGSISATKFKKAWKKRYIEVRLPAV